MAKVYAHPDYPSLVIIQAQSALDRPQPGSFFVTHQTVVLSDIAKRAYGNPTPPLTMLSITKRINRSQYNIQKCFYRVESSNCYSNRVNGQQALNTSSWGPGAWLSLCNIDKAGTDDLGAKLHTPYQVIWIPTKDGKEPWDLEAPVDVPSKPNTPVTIPEIPKEVLHTPSIPAIPGLDINVNVHTGQGGGDPEPVPEPLPEPEPKKAGFPWVLAVVMGGAAIVSVIYFSAKNKKKTKKGKR
jgi:hypothetical protein